MSTTAAAPVTLDVSDTARTPFFRLVAVEWRKMLDTRGGFWLLVSTGILIVLVMAGLLLIAAFVDEDAPFSAADLASVFSYVVSLLAPVFGILIVTSEWSQRTAMVTFALEPHRLKVVAAKLAAVATWAIATIAFALVIGSLTNVALAAIDGHDPVWEITAGRLVGLVLVQVSMFALGFALGTLFLNTPAALAVYYVVALMLPWTLWPILLFTIESLRDIVPWVEITTASSPLTSGATAWGETIEVGATEYLQFVTSAALWVLLPLGLGIWRLLRAELK